MLRKYALNYQRGERKIAINFSCTSKNTFSNPFRQQKRRQDLAFAAEAVKGLRFAPMNAPN